MSATGFRTIELPVPPFRLEIREEDLREPPPLAPYSDNIERLFEEWYDCGLLVIRNVRVPVSCWAEVYRGSPWYEGKRKFWAECKVRRESDLDIFRENKINAMKGHHRDIRRTVRQRFSTVLGDVFEGFEASMLHRNR